MCYTAYILMNMFPRSTEGGNMAITSSPGTTTTESRVAGWLTPNEFAILEAVCWLSCGSDTT